MYTIVFTEDAKKDLKELSKKAPQAVSNCQSSLMKSGNTPGRELVRWNSSRATMALYIPDESPKNIDSSTRFTMKL